MINVIKTRKIWFILSGIILAAGITALALFGLRLGIDFTGGSLSEIQFTENQPELSEVRDALAAIDFGGSITVQESGENSYIIRTPSLSEEKHNELKNTLAEKFGALEELRFDNIGPTISAEIRNKAILQLILVSIGILLYVAWAFRNVPKPLSSWKFGAVAILALVHDLLVVVGVFAVLGHLMQIEIDSLFVTAILTVLGFSVNDTIIVFDRVRENLRKMRGEDFAEIVNTSMAQTIVRSLNTSLTVVLVLLALLLFGAASIQLFILALLIGVVAGSYSSIFIATPLLYTWHKKKFV